MDQSQNDLEETQAATTKELLHLLQKAEAVLTKIQTLVDELLHDTATVDLGLNNRRRLKWLRRLPYANRLRRAFKDITARICAFLILKHLCAAPRDSQGTFSMPDILHTEQHCIGRSAQRARGREPAAQNQET